MRNEKIAKVTKQSTHLSSPVIVIHMKSSLGRPSTNHAQILLCGLHRIVLLNSQTVVASQKRCFRVPAALFFISCLPSARCLTGTFRIAAITLESRNPQFLTVILSRSSLIFPDLIGI